MILAFFLFSNSNSMNDFTINDLFEVKQGKQVLDKVKSNSIKKNEKIISNNSKIKVLTMNSVNFDDKSINPNLLSEFNSSSSVGSNSILTSNSYIVNRVGKNRGMSLLDLDFDFNSSEIIASHHFIILQPRKIVMDNLPFFHTVLDVVLEELIVEKIASNPSKIQYLTVKEIQEKKISIPFEGFDELTKSYMELYEPYKKAVKNLINSRKKLEDFKSNYLKRK
jgi:hypothetical protein